MIIGQFTLAKLAENAKHQDQLVEQLALLANHKSIGITILVLALIRLSYRLIVPAPSLPSSMNRWQVNASKASHILLYGFLFALPISGWLMSSAKAYSVSWFNLVTLPDFIAPSETLAEQFHVVHHYLAEALFVIALVHVLAALKHHLIDKDDVLTRMSSKPSWALFVIVTLLVIGFFGRLFYSPPTATIDQKTAAIPSHSEVTPNPIPLTNNLNLWNIDYDQSSIKFIANQAGAPVEGEWQNWSAEIHLNTKQLDQARFNVAIDLNSGFSNDQERDDTVRSAEFFNVIVFPEAVYRADEFIANDAFYRSNGQLSMKGITAEVALDFSVTDKGNVKVLAGSASLNRFDWNLGTGDWADTTWVGQSVTVKVHVVTKPQPSSTDRNKTP